MNTSQSVSSTLDISPELRRSEIIAILAAGLARFVATRAAGPQKLSESAENGLEFFVETRLSVACG